MPFRPPKKEKQFADLKGILAQYKEPDNALYQVVQEIIERLDQNKAIVEDKLATVGSSENILKNVANKNSTYLTTEDESSVLPNSVQLIAGPGVIFDDSIDNQRMIIATGSHYDAPLSDGDLVEANLIYAAGECVIVQVPI